MKKILFLFALLTMAASVSFAQDRPKAKVRQPKTANWRDDSLLWVKNPNTATIKNPADGNRTKNSSQDKMGNFEIQDVKAPKPTEDKMGNFEIQDKAIVSPRDPASGQATGKRTHKPVRRKPGGN